MIDYKKKQALEQRKGLEACSPKARKVQVMAQEFRKAKRIIRVSKQTIDRPQDLEPRQEKSERTKGSRSRSSGSLSDGDSESLNEQSLVRQMKLEHRHQGSTGGAKASSVANVNPSRDRPLCLVEKIALKFMYEHYSRDPRTIVGAGEEARTQMCRPGQVFGPDRDLIDSQEARR